MIYALQTFIARYSRYKLHRQQCKQYQNQQTIFSHIIKKLSQTAFGKKHNIKPHTDYYAFIKNMPIYDYEQIKPWIEKSKIEANILRPEKIQRFAASSGTTSAKKHIPLTKASIQSTHEAGKDMLSMLISKHQTIRPLRVWSRPLG
jgi:hypothetical protein